MVGHSTLASGYEAFRWTETGGMEGLGFLIEGSLYSRANDVSADGSVVVGFSRYGSTTEAFRWTESGGMESVIDLLMASGIDMTGWTLHDTRAVSYDGLTMVGWGTNPLGRDEAWIAHLGPEAIPEPGTIALAAVIAGLALVLGRRRGRSRTPRSAPERNA